MNDIVKIIRFSKSLRWYYVASAVFVIITSLLGQISPFLIKGVTDILVNHHGRSAQDYHMIVLLLVGVAVVGALTTIISNISGYIGDQLSVKLNSLLSQAYYDHLLKLPMGYYDNELTGTITARLERSIATISNLVQALANTFIGMFLSAIITLGIIGYYSWPVALLMGSLFPIYMWLTMKSSAAWQKTQDSINKDLDVANGRFIESISSIKVVKSFVQERIESRLYRGKRQSIERKTKTQSKRWHFYDVARRLSLDIIFGGVLLLIATNAYRGQLSVGEVVLLLQFLLAVRFPLFTASFIIEYLQRAQAGSKDYFAVLATKPSIVDKPRASKLLVKQASIEYRGITFSYDESNPVLKDISFTIKPGQKVALVGESGQGKTTLANLLLRFYEPTRGEVLIGGVDISDVTQNSLRANIGVVFQEPTLFSGTVADNISYGQATYTQSKLEAAAKAANAHQFIMNLPKGYDTEIGERGVKLSGGQKQRLAIARALMKNPPILILDEATSALDSKAEREVQQALERLMRGRTTLIIAHRLSTIQNVDVVVGIAGGRVAEIGSPAELAHAGGMYAELLALQNPDARGKAKLKKYDIAAANA